VLAAAAVQRDEVDLGSVERGGELESELRRRWTVVNSRSSR
jgi:hypothetical protein